VALQELGAHSPRFRRGLPPAAERLPEIGPKRIKSEIRRKHAGKRLNCRGFPGRIKTL
jgi:hypothetical protein